MILGDNADVAMI